MADLIGLDAKLYRGTAGSSASTLMTNYRKVKVPITFAEADSSRHGSPWELAKVTRIGAEITFEIINNDADADLSALQTAALARTALAFKILDKTSGNGLDADFHITKWERDEDEDGVQIISVSIKPTYVSRYPAWV